MIQPEELAGAISAAIERTLEIDTVTAIRRNERSARFNVRLTNGQTFRVEVEDLAPCTCGVCFADDPHTPSMNYYQHPDDDGGAYGESLGGQ